MKVLVVDDNPADRRILRYVLERHDCHVVEAADGEQGFRQAGTELPDLIISDALMPRMDGFEFLHRIKANSGLKGIPFIFYSSVYTGDRDEKLARSLGADAFMVKPKDPEEIWGEIVRVMERGRSKAAANVEDEEEYLRQYSRIVTAKVEEKVRELERANAVIRQRAKSYRNLFNSIRDVIIVTDDDRVIVDSNQPALRDTFGYELHEVQGRSARILYADDEGYRSAEVPAGKLKRAGGKVVEVPFTKKNGDTFMGELSLIRRLGEEGVPTGIIGIIRDISERKLVEEALRRSERELYQLEAELRLAAEVQAKLLPKSAPLLPGFEIDAACFPARQIGGDFYDWIEITPGVLAVTLGDVMGHGLAAAVLMAEVRATVRSACAHHEPETAMQLVEYALRHDLERSEAFVTLFHARVESKTRQLTFVDCGHGFAFLRRADGYVEEMLPRGLPIGVTSRERYQEGRLRFGPGDALVLYSDGLIDARPELELTPKLLAQCLEGSANAREMVERLTSLPGVPIPPPDDLTVLVVLCTKE